MRRWIQAISVSASLAILAGCVSSPASYPPPAQRPDRPVLKPEPRPQPPRAREPIQKPIHKAPTPAPRQAAHPRYAPPPGAKAYWDNQLGVYVLSNQRLYYRERIFYRWDKRWYSAFSAQGPWQVLELQGVPRGLQALHR